jgi:hypothetical protein
MLRIILFVIAIHFLSACNGQEKNKKNKSGKHKYDQPVTAASSAAGCDKTKWNYVYDPGRLEIKDACKTVTGIIEERNADEDGDEHMLLRLDAGQEGLLTDRNMKKKNGDLVIEAVCINKITRKSAKGACKGYVNDVWLPPAGDHVRVTGSYVVDSHNGWTEIHPVSSIVKM